MSPVFDTFVSDDSITSTDRLGGPDGDLRLVPDLDRLVALAGQPGWAWAPVDRYQQDGSAYPACQRLFAARMVAAAAEQGLELRMAFEIEWACREAGHGGVRAGVQRAGVRDDPAGGAVREYAADLLGALREQGCEVEQLHPEYSAGQFEVSVEPARPGGRGGPQRAGAADDPGGVPRARAAGPRSRRPWWPAHVGNGGHVHLSLWRAGTNLCAGGPGPHGLTATGRRSPPGCSRSWRRCWPSGRRRSASYLRLVPSHWAGAYACWGHETREAALRLITGQLAANLGQGEVKRSTWRRTRTCWSAALLAAGLDGIEPAGAAAAPGDAATRPGSTTAAAAERGIARLPPRPGRRRSTRSTRARCCARRSATCWPTP